MKSFDPRIEWRDPASLTPYSNNAKTHPTEQIDKIAASIASFGFDQPIVVDGDGVIIKGHGRREASLRLGLDRVPVLVRDDLSVAEIKAARIADNKTAESPFDEDMLRVELEALMEDDFDLSLTGFDLEEIDELLAAAEPEQVGLTEDDDVPEAPEQPVTRPGDLWILGSHRLLCGDATVLADVERALGGQLADMVFCDPPYGVNYANSPKDKLRGKHRPILNDNLGEGFEAFLYDACVNILSVTKGAVYWCMSSSRSCTPCSAPSPPPAASGRPSSSGPRIRSRSAAPTTSGSTSRSSTAGRTALSTSGAARATRAMSGSSTSRPGTTFIRP